MAHRLTEFLPLGERTLVMGILNATPDSFSDGGAFQTVEQAVARAQQMAAEGADIIDIGGESTRPGHIPVSLEEELARVIPIVRAVREAVDLPLSIDTYKAEVARQAIQAGANVINDIWGAKKDPLMAEVAVEFDVPIILMHNRTHNRYHLLLDEMKADLEASIQRILAVGGAEEQIILDPGIGFAKSYQKDLYVLRHLEQLTAMGYPVLLGTSRKSVIAKTLHLPPDERVEGTAATVAVGVMKGCQIVRVHDVQPIVRLCRMLDAIMQTDEPVEETADGSH